MTSLDFNGIRYFTTRPRHLLAFLTFLAILAAVMTMLLLTNPAYDEAKRFATSGKQVVDVLGKVRDVRLRILDGFSFDDTHGEFSFGLKGERGHAVLAIELTFRNGVWEINSARLHAKDGHEQALIPTSR